MNKTMKITLLSLVIIVLISAVVFAEFRDESEIYNRIATIKGKVQILNHPELGKINAGGEYLVFQRDGCKYCLIATNADENGNYKIRVGQGKYKIIVYNPSPPTYDMLAPDQPRFVTANSIIEDTEFNINLVIPSEKK